MNKNINDIAKRFGKNVQSYRIKNGMSLEELSLKTGIKTGYLMRIENGTAKRLTCKHIFIFAEAFKIAPHKLCEGL